MIKTQEVLKLIKEHLDSREQWLEIGDIYGLQASLCYAYKAESLIELLEIHNCGSVGGFDKGQSQNDDKSLTARYDWLKNKHILEEKKKKNTRR